MSDKKTEKAKVPMSKKKKIILKLGLTFITLIVVFWLHITFNTRHVDMPEGAQSSHKWDKWDRTYVPKNGEMK